MLLGEPPVCEWLASSDRLGLTATTTTIGNTQFFFYISKLIILQLSYYLLILCLFFLYHFKNYRKIKIFSFFFILEGRRFWFLEGKRDARRCRLDLRCG